MKQQYQVWDPTDKRTWEWKQEIFKTEKERDKRKEEILKNPKKYDYRSGGYNCDGTFVLTFFEVVKNK